MTEICVEISAQPVPIASSAKMSRLLGHCWWEDEITSNPETKDKKVTNT